MSIEETKTSSIEILNKDNTKSAFNLVEQRVQDAITRAMVIDPELFEKNEFELLAELKKRRGKKRTETDWNPYLPSPTDNRLRLNFWTAYEKARAFNEDKISINSIVYGICTKDYFVRTYLNRPEKVAWFLCPPANYQIKIEEGLNFAIDRMRMILQADPFANEKKPDHRLMALQVRIYDLFEKRALGAVTQKIEQTTKNYNVTHTISDEALVNKEIAAQTLQELDMKIKELEKRDRMALPNHEENKTDAG